MQDILPFTDRRGSKNSRRPSSTFAGVGGLSAGIGGVSGRGLKGSKACAAVAASSVTSNAVSSRAAARARFRMDRVMEIPPYRLCVSYIKSRVWGTS